MSFGGSALHVADLALRALTSDAFARAVDAPPAAVARARALLLVPQATAAMNGLNNGFGRAQMGGGTMDNNPPAAVVPLSIATRFPSFRREASMIDDGGIDTAALMIVPYTELYALQFERLSSLAANAAVALAQNISPPRIPNSPTIGPIITTNTNTSTKSSASASPTKSAAPPKAMDSPPLGPKKAPFSIASLLGFGSSINAAASATTTATTTAAAATLVGGSWGSTELGGGNGSDVADPPLLPSLSSSSSSSPTAGGSGVGVIKPSSISVAASSALLDHYTNAFSTPLESAALALTQVLLAAGASLNTQNHAGQTPLHFAAAFSSAACVNVLLVAGALQGVCDGNGFTAYDTALLRLSRATARVAATPSGTPGATSAMAALTAARAVVSALDAEHASGLLTEFSKALQAGASAASTRRAYVKSFTAQRIAASAMANAWGAETNSSRSSSTSPSPKAAALSALNTTSRASTTGHHDLRATTSVENASVLVDSGDPVALPPTLPSPRAFYLPSREAPADSIVSGVTGGGGGARAALSEATSLSRAEDLQLPDSRELVAAGLSALEESAQGLQANLLALHAARERHLLDNAWAAYAEASWAMPENSDASVRAQGSRARFIWRTSALGLLPASTIAGCMPHSLGWGPAGGSTAWGAQKALVASVWRAGHPPLTSYAAASGIDAGSALTEAVEAAFASRAGDKYVRPIGLIERGADEAQMMSSPSSQVTDTIPTLPSSPIASPATPPSPPHTPPSPGYQQYGSPTNTNTNHTHNKTALPPLDLLSTGSAGQSSDSSTSSSFFMQPISPFPLNLSVSTSSSTPLSNEEVGADHSLWLTSQRSAVEREGGGATAPLPQVAVAAAEVFVVAVVAENDGNISTDRSSSNVHPPLVSVDTSSSIPPSPAATGSTASPSLPPLPPMFDTPTNPPSLGLPPIPLPPSSASSPRMLTMLPPTARKLTRTQSLPVEVTITTTSSSSPSPSRCLSSINTPPFSPTSLLPLSLGRCGFCSTGNEEETRTERPQLSRLALSGSEDEVAHFRAVKLAEELEADSMFAGCNSNVTGSSGGGCYLNEQIQQGVFRNAPSLFPGGSPLRLRVDSDPGSSPLQIDTDGLFSLARANRSLSLDGGLSSGLPSLKSCLKRTPSVSNVSVVMPTTATATNTTTTTTLSSTTSSTTTNTTTPADSFSNISSSEGGGPHNLVISSINKSSVGGGIRSAGNSSGGGGSGGNGIPSIVINPSSETFFLGSVDIATPSPPNSPASTLSPHHHPLGGSASGGSLQSNIPPPYMLDSYSSRMRINSLASSATINSNDGSSCDDNSSGTGGGGGSSSHSTLQTTLSTATLKRTVSFAKLDQQQSSTTITITATTTTTTTHARFNKDDLDTSDFVNLNSYNNSNSASTEDLESGGSGSGNGNGGSLRMVTRIKVRSGSPVGTAGAATNRVEVALSVKHDGDERGGDGGFRPPPLRPVSAEGGFRPTSLSVTSAAVSSMVSSSSVSTTAGAGGEEQATVFTSSSSTILRLPPFMGSGVGGGGGGLGDEMHRNGLSISRTNSNDDDESEGSFDEDNDDDDDDEYDDDGDGSNAPRERNGTGCTPLAMSEAESTH